MHSLETKKRKVLTRLLPGIGKHVTRALSAKSEDGSNPHSMSLLFQMLARRDIWGLFWKNVLCIIVFPEVSRVCGKILPVKRQDLVSTQMLSLSNDFIYRWRPRSTHFRWEFKTVMLLRIKFWTGVKILSVYWELPLGGLGDSIFPEPRFDFGC